MSVRALVQVAFKPPSCTGSPKGGARCTITHSKPHPGEPSHFLQWDEGGGVGREYLLPRGELVGGEAVGGGRLNDCVLGFLFSRFGPLPPSLDQRDIISRAEYE